MAMVRRGILTVFAAAFALAACASTFEEARAAVAAACASKIDVNRDGYVEVRSVRRLEERSAFPYEAAGNGKGTVLVLIESRLLQPLSGARSIERSLQTLVQDLAAEGYHAFGLEVRLEDGKRKQGGLTLLGIRRVLQQVRRGDPDLRGVLLVGRYPNAFIVRQHYWERRDDVTVGGQTFRATPWVVSRPEPVATSADIVLADLDGNWEGVYHREARKLPFFVAVYPEGDFTAPTKSFETGTHTYSDYFFVQDGAFAMKQTDDGAVFMRAGKLNTECAPGDLVLPNPMCRPEIAVSRIDASQVAYSPSKRYRQLLDKDGKPQAVTFPAGKAPKMNQRWEFDPFLERRLLYEFFERNHAYRTGAAREHMRPASFSLFWESSVPEMAAGVPGWGELDHTGYDLLGGNLSVDDWVAWMKRPAVFRAIKAHTSPWGSEYGKSRDPKALLAAAGGTAWGWDEDGDALRPAGFAAGNGDFRLYRTLYENHVLPPVPNMFLHTGCDCLTPPHFDSVPFGDENYGRFQGAEALLMYCNGLVLLGRGKVFNDEPVDLGKLLGEGKSWGDVWTHYFEVDAHDPAQNANNDIGIRRKKSYFWSMIGDWTLTLYPNGKG